MRPWLTIALTVTAFQAFAADPPVDGEQTQAQAYCTHKAAVISTRVFVFSQSQNIPAARRQFNAYQEKAMLRHREATEDALQWLSDNAVNVDREIAKARRSGESAATVANNVSIEALANCQANRVAQIRRSGALEAERNATLAEYKSRCPWIEDIQNKSPDDLARICPARNSSDGSARPGG
jgi:hypothetical protein